MYKRKKRKTEIWMSVICWGMCMYFRNKNKSHWFSLSLITTSRFSCFSLAIYFVSSSLLSLSAHGKRWLMVFFFVLWTLVGLSTFFSFFIGYLLILAFLLQRSMSKGNTTIIGRQKKNARRGWISAYANMKWMIRLAMLVQVYIWQNIGIT